MSLIDNKITAFSKTVAALADKPSLGTTALLKQWFDSSPEELRVAHNNLIDFMAANYKFSSTDINVLDYGASGLATTFTGSIASGTKALTLTATPDFVQGQGINLQGALEASSLQVTAAATVSSNVTVTLNGIAFLVAVLSGDTAIGVATKIRAATYAGWTAGGTAGTDTVTFTSLTSGVKTDSTYSAGTTGATGTMTTTTQGTADQISTVSSVSGLVVNIADNATRTITTGTILHDDTVGIKAAINVANALGGGVVFFPTGTYLHSSITLTASNVQLIGIKGATILKSIETYSSNLVSFQIVGDNLTIDGITFSYLIPPNILIDSHNNGGHSLNIGGSGSSDIRSNIVIRNCTFIGAWLMAIQLRYAKNVLCENNEVYNSTGTGIYTADLVQNIVIRKNTVHDCKDDLIMITCDSDNTNGTYDVHIKDNFLYNGNSKGIGTSGVDGCIIEGNYINNTKESAIQIYNDTFYSLGQSLNVTVRKNIIRNAGKFFNVTGSIYTTLGTTPYGIYIAGSTTTGVHVTDNDILSSQSYGITVIAGSKMQFTKNTINTSGYGMSIGNDAGVYTSIYDVLIADNYVCNTDYDGIMVFGGTNIKVSDNQVHRWNVSNTSSRRGMHIRTIQYGTVCNNHLYDELARGSAFLISGTNSNLKYWGNNQISTTDTINASILLLDRKVTFGATAPSTGTWAVGDVCFNSAPTLLKNISHWVCAIAGTSGSWLAHGCGTGTTANRPTLTNNDAGYLYYDTTTLTKVFWTGSAWA